MTKRGRSWLPFVAAVLAAAAALPPAGTYARLYAVAQAVQFALFAIVVPALLAVGWPARSPARRERHGATPAGRASQPGVRAAVSVLPFAALVVAWRLPWTLSSLDRDPALTAAELVTLAGAGTLVWLELTAGLAARHPLPRPLRAGIAAAAMWTIWIVAYVAGMSGPAAVSGRTGAVSAADGRQLAVAVLWAVPAIFFAPVVYANLIEWLGDRNRADPPVTASDLNGDAPGVVNAPRPPRGWRR